jgi:hypothetical protein
MNDVAHIGTRHREKIDAPELGASVWLVECSVDELLPLFVLVEAGKTVELMLGALAVTLEIDGNRVTEDELRAMGARKFRTLMRIGPQALRINSIVPEADTEKKS